MLKHIKNLTLGIEEEYQLIDPKTRELTSYISEILEQGSLVFKDEVKPELLQSQIEIGSQVCSNVDELKIDLQRLRGLVRDYAAKENLSIIAAGTHPFSHWKDQVVTDNERYHGFMDSTQYVGKRMLISSPKSIANYIKNIPYGAERNIKDMRLELAKTSKAHNTCPLTTEIFLRIELEH